MTYFHGMFFPDIAAMLLIYRPHRDLEKDWQELREWVQEHQAMIRINGVAIKAKISPEMTTALLLRDQGKTRASRGFDRLDALLAVFMSSPWNYRPSWLNKVDS